jgi:hypothetical protein
MDTIRCVGLVHQGPNGPSNPCDAESTETMYSLFLAQSEKPGDER